MRPSTEAEEQYLARISADCREILGGGIALLDLRVDDEQGRLRLIARFQLADEIWESTAVGTSVVDAHAHLRNRLVSDRVRLGFVTLTGRQDI
jgi:hypothetical protein